MRKREICERLPLLQDSALAYSPPVPHICRSQQMWEPSAHYRSAGWRTAARQPCSLLALAGPQVSLRQMTLNLRQHDCPALPL